MPQIIYTPTALANLVRLRDFLKTKNPEAAARTVATTKLAIQNSAVRPERFRPVQDLMHYREIIIDFGSSGYAARFRYERGSGIVIVRIKHQLENDF